MLLPRRYLFFLIAVLSSIILVQGQDYRFKFKHYNVDEGLAHTDATAIAEDDAGFIWIATYGGLNKYDGYAFRYFRNDIGKLTGTYTNRIMDLSYGSGFIFLATQGGLATFDTKREKFIPITWVDVEKLQLPEKIAHVLVQGNIVYFTTEKKVWAFEFKLDHGRLVLRKMPFASRSDIPVRRLAKGKNGAVWLTSALGLFRITKTSDDQSLEISKVQVLGRDKRELVNFYGLFIDDDRQMWLGGESTLSKADLYSLDANRLNAVTFDDFKKASHMGLTVESNTPIEINCISKTDDGQSWIGTAHGLIAITENEGMLDYSFYNNNNEVEAQKTSTQRINNLFTDRNGNLWVTTYGGGVNFVDVHQKKFHLITMNPYDIENSLPSKFVRAILEDEKGNLWIGTERNGLVYYDLKKQQVVKTFVHDENDPFSILDDNIRSLAFDSQGKLWIGSLEGITIMDLKRNSSTYLKHDPENPGTLSANSIFDITMDKFGNMWAGSWLSGLNRIQQVDGQYQIERFNVALDSSDIGLTSEIISHVYADNIYPEVFVSTDNGLNHIYLDFEGKVSEIRHYMASEKDSTSLRSNFVWPVERANDTVLWVGTIGGGLHRVILSDKTSKGYHTAGLDKLSGMPFSDVESMLLDGDESVWVAGNGLSKLNTTTMDFINYKVEDGLQGNSFKIGGAHKGSSGRFYFGGTQGITYFYPNEIVSDTTGTNVVLTNFSINNQDVTVGHRQNGYVPLSKSINQIEGLTLKHMDNNFTIAFSSLSFANPKGSKYRYMLEGFDKDWVEIDGEYPFATYANLDYKDYTFKLMSANNSGVWSKTVKSLPISIRPPWWGTVLAKCIYSLLFLTLLYFVFRWVALRKRYAISILEKQQEEEINRLRLQFFTNMSHEFRTPLTLIVNPLQELLKGNLGKRKRQRYYAHMLNNSKRMLRLINELMDFQKIETKAYALQMDENDIHSVIREVYDSFLEFSYSKSIQFRFLPKIKIPPFWFDRTVLEKILYNILGNAFKYTEKEGQIEIDLLDEFDLNTFQDKKHIKIGNLKEGQDYIWIRISDTGRGISEHEIAYIFDRFFHKVKQDADVSTVTEGSGVGLSLVKSLIILHQGCIYVSSEVDVGTVFYVALPFVSGKPELGQTTRTEVLLSTSSLSPVYDRPELGNEIIHNYGKPIVLVVEDNVELLHFIKENLEDEFEVLQAQNGVEALREMEANRPSLIVSDVKMPKMDGIEFCERIKSQEIYEDIPVLLLSSNISDEQQLRGAYAQADLYIPKPFSVDVLKVNIKNIIANRQKLKKNIIENSFAEAHNLNEEAKTSQFLQKVVSIIMENLEDTDFDVSVLSEKLNMSRTNVYNKVKNLTGKSTGTLVREIRVKKAAQMMASKDISIAQAMYNVGIQSQSYFTKVFKKEYGMTPSQFVKEMGKKKEESNED